MRFGLWTLVGGEVIVAHHSDDCLLGPCSVHSPSEHHMSEFPQHWRDDRGIMERICRHGVGHPDPDDPKVFLFMEDDGVHGCDGCCSPWSGISEDVTAPDVNININVHPGVDYTPRFDALEELIMTTKAELEVKVDELLTAQAEAASDLTRILAELEALVAAGDLAAIAAKVDEAKAVAVAMSEAADAAVADPTDVPPPPPEPVP